LHAAALFVGHHEQANLARHMRLDGRQLRAQVRGRRCAEQEEATRSGADFLEASLGLASETGTAMVSIASRESSQAAS